MNALGTAVFALGLVTALTLADEPMAVVTGALFGFMGLLAVWARFREHPAARSAVLALSALWTFACALLELAALHVELPDGRERPGPLTALRGLRRAVSARRGRPRWTDAELAVLDNAEGLQWLLGGLPAARRERRLP